MNRVIPGGKTKEINRLFGRITAFLSTAYVLFYLCIFPSCVHNKYFDILNFRFELFWKPTFVMGIVFLLLGAGYLLADRLYNGGSIKKGWKEERKTLGLKKYLKEKLTKGDVLFLALLLCITISTAFAEYPYEAFWGNRGRNYGLLLWLMYGVAYILVTRFYRLKEWHFYAFLLSGLVPCIWGICNFFMIDFGYFEQVDPEKAYIFASSIGNINTYTNYVGMIFGASAAAFVLGKTKVWEGISFIVAVISLTAGIMGKSDNVILWIAAVFCMLPFIAWNTKREFEKYSILGFFVFAAMLFTGSLVNSGIATMNDVDPGTLIELGRKSWMPVVTGAVLVFVLFICCGLKKVEMLPTKRLRYGWSILLATLFTLVVVLLVITNTRSLPTALEPYRNFLVFSDAWGTGRGLGWRLGMEYWKQDTTLFTKLFGYGPDTYYIITMDRFMNVMQRAGYGMFDSAHNEYFEYFITIGIVGVILYIWFLIYTVKKGMGEKDVKKGYIKKCMSVACVAYAVQAVVNIAIPITTVVFMLLVMAIYSGYREEN